MTATRDDLRTGPLIAIAPISAIVVIGAVLRITQFDQSLFADEMWSYVGASRPSFGEMLDFVRSDEEITPPLFTVAAWISAKLGDPTQLVRLPSLLAGIATIPLVYVLGLRTLGRPAALTSAALVALSPFLAWYSIEVRAYALAIVFVTASTLCLLLALERDGRRRWIAYALLSCAAMYTHYTAAYVLLAQVGWALWFYPPARLKVLLANAGAALAFLPWLPGLSEDLDSPTQGAIASLAPFNFDNFTDFTARFAAGHPAAPLNAFWGPWGELVLVAGLVLTVAGLLIAWIRGRATGEDDRTQRRALLLFAVLALAAPVGIGLVSLVGDDMFLPRNLATSLPFLLLCLGAALHAGPPVIRAAAITLLLGVFAYGAIENTTAEWQRPAFKQAAGFIDETAAPDDVVLDVAIIGVGGAEGAPLSPPAITLDINLEEPHEVIDVLPDFDPDEVLARAAGHRLFLVGNPAFLDAIRPQLRFEPTQAVDRAEYAGLVPEAVEVYEVPASVGSDR